MNTRAFTLGRLDVAVFTFGGVRQPEMHAHRILVVMRPQDGKRSRADTRPS